MDTKNDELWGLLYENVSKSLGLNNQNFQLILPFTNWNWDTAALGQTDAQQYSFLDSLPTISPVGSYQSGSSFALAYRSFLDSLIVEVDSGLQNQLDIQSNIYDGLLNDFERARNTALEAYAAEVPDNKPSFKDWLQDFLGGISYGKTLEKKGKDLTQQEEILDELRDQTLDRELKRAREDYNNSAFETKVVSENIKDPTSEKAYSPIDSFGKWIQQNAAAGNSLKFSFSTSSSSNAIRQTFAGASVTIERPFWEVTANGKTMNLSEVMKNQSVDVILTLEAASNVAIAPENWFNEALVVGRGTDPAKLRQGVTPRKAGAGKHLFGAGGIIPARHTDMLVGYRPKFTVKTSSTFSEKTMETISAATKLRIGPFVFKGSGSNSNSIDNLLVTNSEFSGTSESDFPVIFGTKLKVYG